MYFISVCIATYNGEKYIKQQLESILLQLDENAEVIISDDGSSDNTLTIIEGLNDKRIKVFSNNAKNLIKNFENALKLASGNAIFLSDQDDLWEPDKVEKVLHCFDLGYDLVLHDCKIINSAFETLVPSYFKAIDSHPGIIRNIIKRNSYMGCCMAFTYKVKNASLPFPDNIPMHDFWIGMIAETLFKPHFIENKLVLYRQHEDNSSDTSAGISKYNFWQKLGFRVKTVTYLVSRILKNKF